jgi:hypothetical protein
MEKYVEIETSSLYAVIIEQVMKSMHKVMKTSGYGDETVKKIQNMWKDNINKAPRSKFAHIVPLILHSKPTKLEPEVVKPEPPIPPKPETPSVVAFSDSDVSEQEEEDPNVALFHNFKQKEEDKKIEESKPEEEKIESDDDLQVSDDETNQSYPEPTGIMHCLHEKVKRKGNDWSLCLKACVYQEVGRNEIFFRSAQSRFTFYSKKY